MTVVDVAPVKVSGALDAPRARVIWSAGTLAVFTAPDAVRTVASDRPERKRGVWTAATADGVVEFARSGCSCGFGLARTPRADLMARL